MVRAATRHDVEQSQDRISLQSEKDYFAPSLEVRDGYKRFFDLSLIVLIHLLFFPVFLILWTLIPLAIWLEDRGPIFYSQRRVGRNGRVFELYKFRSMVLGAENMTGPVWASEGDSRITRVGSFIRRRALDELPQVINVIKGDMSLVGPRPERPEFVDSFAEDTPRFLHRLKAYPGLTGIAQVYGRYASRPAHKLRYDMLYVENMSPWIDIKLIYLSGLVTLCAKWQASDKKLRLRRRPPSGSHPPSRVKTVRYR